MHISNNNNNHNVQNDLHKRKKRLLKVVATAKVGVTAAVRTVETKGRRRRLFTIHRPTMTTILNHRHQTSPMNTRAKVTITAKPKLPQTYTKVDSAIAAINDWT